MSENLASGNSVTIPLDANDYVSVTGTATVIANGPSTAVSTTNSSTRTYGPYAGGAIVRVISGGSVTYTITRAAGSDEAVKFSSNGGQLTLDSDGAEAVFGPDFAYNYVLLALLGDSRWDGAYITASGANTTIGVATGDTYISSGNPQTWAEIMGCGLITVRNFAVSGSKTARLLEGASAGSPGQVDDLIAASLDPDTTLPVILSSANDRAVAPVVGSSTSIANLTKAIHTLRGHRYDVGVCYEPPQRGAYWTGIMPTEHAAFLAAQKELVSQDPVHLRAIDMYSPVVDGSGSVPAFGSANDPYADDVHFKCRGALLEARQLSNGLDYRLPENRLSAGLALSTTGNVLTNPEFTGSSTTTVINSGTVGNNWRSDRTAGNSWEKSLVCSATASARANSTAYAVGDRITVNQLPAPTARANSTAYAIGDRITVSSKPGFEFVCTQAGTSAASAPTFNTFMIGATTTDNTAVFTAVEKVDVGALFQNVEFVCLTAGTSDSSLPRFSFNLFELTTDGSAVFVAVPRYNGFDGFRSHLLYGDGTTDNVRGSFRQDISMSTAGIAVGDTVEASIFWKSMFAWQGIQLEVQFLTGGAAGIGATGTKVQSHFFPGMNYLNTNLEERSMFGRLNTRVVVPSGCDTIRFVPTVFSRAGVRQAHYFTRPVLRKVTA